MIKGTAAANDFIKELKDTDIVSASQDKRSFYKEILDNISDSEEEKTILVYLLNDSSTQATLVAERNFFSDYLKDFLTIDANSKTMWAPVKENRIKVFRNLVSNQNVGEKIKSLQKSSALGVPITSESGDVIGSIWVLGNNDAKTTSEYVNLKNSLLEATKKIAWKEEHDKNKDGLH